jgi:hypothetical protein
MSIRSISGGAIVLALAACGSEAAAPPGPAMPFEAAGLVPGVSTEADVTKAWPGAEVRRDRKFGGDGVVAYNGRPGLAIATEHAHAWLVELGGAPVVVSLEVPIARTCAEVMPSIAPRRELGPCGNRVADPGEYATCTRTVDGKQRMEVSCFDRKSIEYGVHVESRGYGI